MGEKNHFLYFRDRKFKNLFNVPEQTTNGQLPTQTSTFFTSDEPTETFTENIPAMIETF